MNWKTTIPLLGFLDLFPALEGHPEWFFDGVHPNANGAKVIAETVFHCIKEMER